MTLKLRIYPGSIGFFIIWLQNFKMCSALNTIELQEMDYLSSNLSPEECFQLYNLLDHRHIIRGDTSKYINKEKKREIPCFNLLASWFTDPDESSFQSLDKVAVKLAKIGRKDLAFWLDQNSIRSRHKIDAGHISRVEELDRKKAMHKAATEDGRIQRSTCPTVTLERMQTFWKFFFIALVILILALFCVCCYRFIYEKLCSIFSRAKEEKEETYCLCRDQYGTTSFQDYYSENKEPSLNYKRMISKLKSYFENHKEKNNEKLRSQEFEKLQAKLQKMYLDQRKKVKVNRQEERILNSLTEEERDKLGEMIREMKFLVDFDEESEKLLLSNKRQGNFIIDMRNLRRPKISRPHESIQDMRNIKEFRTEERLSISLSENIMVLSNAETKKSSERENSKNNREKKNSSDQNKNKQRKENIISSNCKLEVKSEFLKCHAVSDSDQNYSSPFDCERNQRISAFESGRQTSFLTSDETDFSTFRSEEPKFENFDSTQPSIQNKNIEETKSEIEEHEKSFKLNITKSASTTKLECIKSNFDSRLRSQKERINEKNNEPNGNYSEYYKNKDIYQEIKQVYKNSSRISLDSTSASTFTSSCRNRNSGKDEYFYPYKNSDHGDTESQLDLYETYNELGLLFSQHLKQQTRPCYRNYCLLRRHLRRGMHDLRQCRVKRNYFQYYPNGEAPACSSGNICKDTYDEFNLMRASPKERHKIRQEVYDRRKKFLDQPCVSHEKQIFSG